MAQLPALSFNPQSALIDFSPVTNALENNRRNALMQREDARQNEELTLRKDQMRYQRGRDQKLDAVIGIESRGFILGAAMPRGALQKRLETQIGPLTAVYLLPIDVDQADWTTRVGDGNDADDFLLLDRHHQAFAPVQHRAAEVDGKAVGQLDGSVQQVAVARPDLLRGRLARQPLQVVADSGPHEDQRVGLVGRVCGSLFGERE